MTRQALFFALIFWMTGACGCTSTRQIDLDSPDAAETIRVINEGSQSKKAKVEFADRQRAAARSLLIAPDTTSWLTGNDRRFVTSTHDLRQVQFNRRGQGAMEGLAFGALVGVASAFGVLLANQEFKDASRGIQVVIPVGSLAGILFGAIRGNRRTYVFTPQAPPRPVRMPPVIAEASPPVQEPSVVEEPAGVKEQPVAEEPSVVEEPLAAEQEVAEVETPTDVSAQPEPVTPVLPPARFDRDQVSWTVVLASYPDQASADADVAQYREQLGETGYPVDVITESGQYRVVVGQFEKLVEAQEVQQGLVSVSAKAWLLYYQPS